MDEPPPAQGPPVARAVADAPLSGEPAVAARGDGPWRLLLLGLVLLLLVCVALVLAAGGQL